MTRQYADLSIHQVSEEHQQHQEEFYQAGRLWGEAGNKKLPKTFCWDRGDHVTHYPIVGSASACAQAFCRGWKETKPAK